MNTVALDNQLELERIRTTFLLKVALAIKSVEEKLGINMFEREINSGCLYNIKNDKGLFKKFKQTPLLTENTTYLYFTHYEKIISVVCHSMNCFHYFYPEDVLKSIIAFLNEQSIEDFEHTTNQIKNTFRFNTMKQVYMLFLKKYLWNEFRKTINLFRFDFIQEIKKKSRERLINCPCGKKVKFDGYKNHLKTKFHQQYNA